MSHQFILFDLDGTLYPGDSELLREIGRRIQAWLQDRLGLTWEAAGTLRHDYFRRYGTTLSGLIAEHRIDAQDFLHYVHDIPVERYLKPEPALATMLTAIPLRRAVYTNASTGHSRRVLDALGISDRFERVVSIEDVGLRNKLYEAAFEQALALLGAQGGECIMVEDSPRNLHTAKALGMTTILVGSDGNAQGAKAPDRFIDIYVDSVLDVGEILARLNNV